MTKPMLGVIGGSGLYEMADLEQRESIHVATPYGPTSDELVVGTLGDQRVVFIPRHGRTHRLLPSEVPYRANIWALKSMGCEYVLSVSAGGSLQENIAPGSVVCVDQYIDRTSGRSKTYFGSGIVGHLPFADPVCATFHQVLIEAAQATSAQHVFERGTYVCIDGPTFSTRAESRLFRQWGADCVGMTNLPEARLAREAEMSYASAILITDWDCWKERDDVRVEDIMKVLRDNAAVGQSLIRNVTASCAKGRLPEVSPQRGAAQFSIVTQSPKLSEEHRSALNLFYSQYLG